MHGVLWKQVPSIRLRLAMPLPINQLSQTIYGQLSSDEAL